MRDDVLPIGIHCASRDAGGEDVHPCHDMGQAKLYRVISLFSGGMGLDIGLELTGRFEVIACVEKEQAYCETIKANQRAGHLSPNLKVFQRDIINLDPKEIMDTVGIKPGELDLLAGGPPCQSFSTAGNRGTIQDPRGTLLWQFLRFVDAFQPRFFLMENVRGLLSAARRHRTMAERPDKGGAALQGDEQHGSVVRAFADDLQKISDGAYHMDCFEVNAVNYGAPQLRERALFIGNRFNAVSDFPSPTHGTPQPADKSAQATLFNEVQPGESRLKPWRTLGDAINGLVETDPVIMDFSPRKKKYLGMIPAGSNWRSLPTELQRESMGKAWLAKGGRSGWWRRLSFELPCPTLVTMPNHAGTALCHPKEVRALSLGEYARIQEFPDHWRLLGTPAQRYAQLGNAVPVRLGRIAGDVIASQMDLLARGAWQPLPNKPASYRVIYVQSHVRTRHWFKGGETLVWRDGEASRQPTYGTPKTHRKSRAI